jgi:tetratricopeptide (TPR) repeat protein
LYLLFLIVLLSAMNTVAQNSNSEGTSYLEEKQYNFAKEYFEQQLKIDPENVSDRIGLGNSCLAMQQRDSAKTVFKKLLERNYQNPFAMIGLGHVALLYHDRAGELEYFERARRSEKNNPEVYCAIAAGCLNYSIQDTVTALNYLRQGLDLFPKYARLHHLTGELETLKKNYGSALNAYERAIFFDSKSVLSYRNMGSIHLLARAYKDAQTALNKSIALDPEQVICYKYLGDLYYATGRYEEAEHSYQTYRERTEVSEADDERFALTLFFNKKYQEAEKLLEKLNEINNDETILLRIRGYIAYETGEFQKALDQMNRFFRLHDPQKVIALDYCYYGNILLKLGDYGQATSNFKKALLLDPEKPEIYEELAKLSSRNGMHDESAGYYKKKMEHGADKLVNHFLAGKEFYLEGEKWRLKNDSIKEVQLGNHLPKIDKPNFWEKMKYYYTKADSAFTVVSQLNPDYAGSYIWKGRIQSILDPEASTTIAKEAYLKALSLLEKTDQAKNQKSIIECYKYLGSYYYLGYERNYKTDKKLAEEMKAKSIDSFTKIKDLDPTDPQANEVLKKINNQ